MKWRFLAGGAALLVASVCVPPPPPPPNVPCTAPPVAATYKIAVSYVEPVSLPGYPGPHTRVFGTITNTGPCPTFYYLRVVASSGHDHAVRVYTVFPGETALWMSTFVGDVTVANVRVTPEPFSHLAPAIPAAATITSVEPTQVPDIGAATAVKGTLTNTGTTPGTFIIELQANNGQGSWGVVHDLRGGASGTWTATFSGTVTTARILRITTGGVERTV